MSINAEIVALYKDETFKSEFIANYINAGISKYTAQAEFTHAFNIIANDFGSGPNRPPLSTVNMNSIKQAMLVVSEQGVSFNPENKELIFCGAISEREKPYAEIILRYRGMYTLAMRSKNVRSVAIELVYEKDSFTWLGSDEAPVYASTASKDQGAMTCGFVSIRLNNGAVASHKMTHSELLAVEAQSLQYEADMTGSAEGSLYNTPWRERCLKAVLWRSAFNLLKNTFLANYGSLDASGGEVASDVAEEFEKRFADALASAS